MRSYVLHTMLYVSGFVITLGYIDLFNYDNQFLFAEKRVKLKNYQPKPKGAVSLRWSAWQSYDAVHNCKILFNQDQE